VIAGESLGVKANIETRTPMMYLDVTTQPGGQDLVQEVPSSFEGFVYCYQVCLPMMS
jgi:redox-sensitive bicupin YhaK (pirin superfamily)